MVLKGETTGWTGLSNAGVRTTSLALNLNEVLFPPILPKHPGIYGNLDHQAGVRYVTELAEDRFPRADGYEYQYNVSIKNFTGGIDRKPDLTIWRDVI